MLLSAVSTNVSNPWREAIEGILHGMSCAKMNVSNPWREAIEAVNKYYC